MSCLKYAYHHRRIDPTISLAYYAKSCELGNDSACKTHESLERKSINFNLRIVKRSARNVYSCYINHAKDRREEKSLFDKKSYRTITISVRLSKEGKLLNSNVDGGKFTKKGSACVKNVFKSSPFRPHTREQMLSVDAKIERVHKKPQNWGTKVLDSLK
jgi:hypothetical protein